MFRYHLIDIGNLRFSSYYSQNGTVSNHIYGIKSVQGIQI